MTDKEKELQAEAIDYYRKQIADLKKENAELRARVEKQNADILFLKHLTEQLEKENADLQKSYQDLYNSMRVIKDQRNKAKEIIKDLLNLPFASNEEVFAEKVVEIIWSFGNIIEKREKQIKKLEAVNRQAKEILFALLKEEKENMYWEMNGSDKSSYFETVKKAKALLKE